MNGVINPIKVRTYGNDKWELLEPFEWNGIIVPCGFITDFASIPAMVRGFINPVGKIRPAALVHDYLYYRHGDIELEHIYSRRECDRIFLKIMEYVDFSWIKRHLAYRAVRLFGWIAWCHKDKDQKLTDFS